jgi:hypothetical protein
MPPELDIYGLTKHRDAVTINRFLDEYVDREASADRGDEELALTPLDSKAGIEWEPALTLAHIIERGLDYPRRSFTDYLTSSQPGIERVILSFTEDDWLVLGLAIDDEGAQPKNEATAKALLAHLLNDYSCSMGIIVVEEPPPESESAFRTAREHPLTVFFIVR